MATIATALRRPVNPTGPWSWITTVDHKRIGILYGATAFIFFMFGGAEALIMRIQLARPEQTLVDPEHFNQLFTMHGTTMIFLAIMPLSAAFFNFLIPLMIGARDVAFPRLNAFSYWVFLGGGIMLNLSWWLGGAPNAGWFGYAPLTSSAYNAGVGVDWWVLSLQVLGVASLASAFNFIVTILNMRAPGMSLFRMPVFVWMTLVTAFLLIFAFPVITVALIELLFDRNFGTNFFVAANGGDPILWQHLFWIFGHPEVYILILPAMGIVSEILPTFSRKPLFGYPFIIFSGIVIGFMGWAVWSHHMFTVGLGPVANTVFMITTMAIAIPTGVKIFNWMGTMWGGSLRLQTPMLFAIGFVFLFIVGGLSGVMHAISPSDAQQQDTYFIVAHIHYVLFGGAIMGILGGIYYWFPKITGRMMHEGLGKLHFWATFIGMNATFFPMHFLGLDGMPRRIFTYESGMGWDLWNFVASVGAIFLGVSMLLFLHNAVRSWRKGQLAGGDPWDARTLEWSMPSPPPVHNFDEIPVVRGRDAWWQQKRRRAVPAPVAGGAGERGTGPSVPRGGAISEGGAHEQSNGHGSIHLPSPSYFPLLAAIGITLAAFGIVYTYFLTAFGIFMALASLYGWYLEPITAPSEGEEH